MRGKDDTYCNIGDMQGVGVKGRKVVQGEDHGGKSLGEKEKKMKQDVRRKSSWTGKTMR